MVYSTRYILLGYFEVLNFDKGVSFSHTGLLPTSFQNLRHHLVRYYWYVHFYGQIPFEKMRGHGGDLHLSVLGLLVATKGALLEKRDFLESSSWNLKAGRGLNSEGGGPEAVLREAVL